MTKVEKARKCGDFGSFVGERFGRFEVTWQVSRSLGTKGKKCSIFLKFRVRIAVNRKRLMLIQAQASSRTGRIAKCVVHPC